MNSIKTPKALNIAILAIISLFSSTSAKAQAYAAVTSTNGYTVYITLDVVRIIAPKSCKYGYNFNTRISYDVTFAGNNIPKKLYTLQTVLACGSYDNFTSLPLGGGKGQRNTHSNPWNPNSDCATATASSLNCNSFDLEIEGPGIARQTITMNINTVLPVKLISYDAKLEQKNVNITWETASELNNSHFIVERSNDANNWTKVGQVDAVKEQNAVNAYNIVDEFAAEGANYYRLTQVDVDGTVTVYPSIMYVEVASSISFDVYPNPATTQFSVKGEGMDASSVSIMDAMGRTIELNGEINGDTITFSTESLDAGIYSVIVNNMGVQKAYKLTVAK